VPLEAVDELAHLHDLDGVESGGRLVEDQQLGPLHDGLGHADALTEAVREAGDDHLVRVPERSLLLCLGHRARDLVVGHAAQAGDEAQVVAHRHLVVQGRRCPGESR